MSRRMIAAVLVLFALCFSGCSASEADIEEAVTTRLAAAVAGTLTAAPTATALPTLTLYPTLTPYPTGTPYPTYTPKPTPRPRVVTATPTPTPKFTPTNTSTPTITPTPTSTSTPTPTPNATQTQQAIVNATRGADATATRIALDARATDVARHEQINYKELATYPDSHVGERVQVSGRVFNINGNTELQMWLGWTYDAVYVVMRDPFSGIYEDDWITVYGRVAGEHCGRNAYGAEVCHPLLKDAFYDK